MNAKSIGTATFAVLVLFANSGEMPSAQGARSIAFSIDGRKITVELAPIVTQSQEVDRIVASRLRSILLDNLKRASSNTVNPKLLSQCLDAYFTESGMQQSDVDNISSRQRLILRALQEVVLGKKNEATVYREQLKDRISLNEWRVWVTNYTTPDKLKAMESMIPRSIDNLQEQSRSALKTDIETWLMFEGITGDVQATETEVELLYARVFPLGLPPLQDVKSEVRALANAEIKSKRVRKWWEGVLASHTVVVPAPYGGAVELAKVPPYPNLPEAVIKILRSNSQ